jgi:hypothetical protein
MYPQYPTNTKKTRSSTGFRVVSLLAAAFALAACGGANSGGTNATSSAGVGQSYSWSQGSNKINITLTRVTDPAPVFSGFAPALDGCAPASTSCKAIDVAMSVQVIKGFLFPEDFNISAIGSNDLTYGSTAGNLSPSSCQGVSSDNYLGRPGAPTTLCLSFVVPTGVSLRTVTWRASSGSNNNGPGFTWHIQ